MLRDWVQFYEDILESCELILSYSAGLTWESFSSDRKSRDALLLQVLQIGEAGRHIPEDVRVRFPQVPWAQLVATRNVLIHAYFAIDNHLLWDIVANKIPELLRELQRIRQDNPALFQ